MTIDELARLAKTEADAWVQDATNAEAVADLLVENDNANYDDYSRDELRDLVMAWSENGTTGRRPIGEHDLNDLIEIVDEQRTNDEGDANERGDDR